jgi:hypothetical protein
MAFVSQSPRQILAPIPLGSHKIGPGDYTNDLNTLSKSASVKRKQPAFGFGDERKLNKVNDTSQITPGKFRQRGFIQVKIILLLHLTGMVISEEQ